jgi:hypothetical protein
MREILPRVLRLHRSDWSKWLQVKGELEWKQLSLAPRCGLLSLCLDDLRRLAHRLSADQARVPGNYLQDTKCKRFVYRMIKAFMSNMQQIRPFPPDMVEFRGNVR